MNSDPAVQHSINCLISSEKVEYLLELLATLTSAVPEGQRSKYLTAREAATYLRISYSTFRKKATKIRRQPGTRRYRVEDLDEFAASLRPKKKR